MATSWNIPALVNKILSDLPGIRTLLQSLAKMDYTGTTDIPTGAVRMAQVEGGWQLQRYNGTSWVSVGKLIHDADSVDGKSASTTATADTIPVRDSSGKIPGDITGNAATATSAAALSTTLAIGKGGTGATSASAARSNLGAPPTNHASSGTTYGLSSATVYGHAMATSDAPAQDTDAGSIGTDVTHFARADHAHKKVLGTSTVYGQVKLTDSVSSTSAASSHIGASAKAVKTAYDKAVDAADAAVPMIGATSSAAGAAGLVPAPAMGAQNKPLRGDGTWGDSLECEVSRLSGTHISEVEDTIEWWKAKGNSVLYVSGKKFDTQPATYGTIINTFIGSNLQQLFLTAPKGDIFKRGANSNGWNGNADDPGNWSSVTNSMPVGAIYVQFSGQSSPSDLFGGTWSNVSSSYAGRFFRAEGGSAASFGNTQADAAPDIHAWASGIETYKTRSTSGAFTYSSPVNNNVIGSGSDFGSAALNFNASYSNGKYGDANEFRPVNSTIRIWKRTE